jgi:acyl transferase domain-containing protein/acyl carrier protein/thioesterase domain-containing protein
MKVKHTNYNQEWGVQIVDQYRKAWNGQLFVESFSKLFASSFIFHYHNKTIKGVENYIKFIDIAKKTTQNLDLVPIKILANENKVLLYFRWSAKKWHEDIKDGNLLSNFCKVVLIIENGKIVEQWEQAPDFIYLFGKKLSGTIIDYPKVCAGNMFEEKDGGLYLTHDKGMIFMKDVFSKLNDCIFGLAPIRKISEVLHDDLYYQKGNIKGKGIAEMKTFAYALKTAFGKEIPHRFEEAYIKKENLITAIFRWKFKNPSPAILNSTNGMVAFFEFEMKNDKIQSFHTHIENYLSFLHTDFSKHEIRMKDLFQGKQMPVLQVEENQKIDMLTPSPQEKKETIPLHREEKVAIVGIAGRFPKCDTVEEYWQMLVDNKSAFSEISAARPYINFEKGIEKTYAGLINNVDAFDAAFFNIPPVEVEYMDPQQRLLMEVIWHSMEDSMHASGKYSGARTGVFVSTLSGDYGKLMQDHHVPTNEHYWKGNEPAIFPAKIARFFDIQGPCKFVNTECSSGLFAIHEASELIKSGNIDQAIVGGTNLFLHHYGFSVREDSILSKEKQPYIFSKKSKGQLRGEAVVSVILKSLTKAIEDNDKIYGIVEGSAVNNSGKTFSVIAPNTDKQAEVIIDAWHNASVKPSDIGLIECHASGVREGDFAEITAIKKAYEAVGKQSEDIAKVKISTIKGAIGHAEAASGLTVLVKLLLQLKHNIIPGIKGIEAIDTNLGIDKSNLNLIDQNTPWNNLYKNGIQQPRIAGMNAFAAGGYNAHVVIKEYREEVMSKNDKTHYNNNIPLIFPLSARNEESLRAVIQNFLKYLDKENIQDIHNVAYTLQIAKDVMEERLVAVVENKEQLIKELTNYLNGQKNILFISNDKDTSLDISLKTIAEALQNKEPKFIAQAWVIGVTIDWNVLYSEQKPHKIALPKYPFLRKKYWIPNTKKQAMLSKTVQIHQLLHSNSSTLKEQKYSSVFTGKETFLQDHKVKSTAVLPGVAYIEMARVAGEEAIGEKITCIKDVIWVTPIELKVQSKKIDIRLYSDDEGVAYEIYSQKEEEIIHGQGKLSTKQLETPSSYDLVTLNTGLTDNKSGTEFYALFEQQGMNYGTSFQGIETIYYSTSASLSKIRLPIEDGYVLQPGLLDCALQTCMGMKIGAKMPLNLPFSVKEVKIYGDVHKTTWCYARVSSNSKTSDKVMSYEIDMLSDMGEVILSFTDFAVLPVDGYSSEINKKVIKNSKKEEGVLYSKSNLETPIPEQAKNASVAYLKTLLATSLKLPIADIKITDTFEKYGLDSMMIIKITNELNEQFKDLPSTLFFEYLNLESLANYFAREHSTRMLELVGAIADVSTQNLMNGSGIPSKKNHNIRERFASMLNKESSSKGTRLKEDIAIIGLSGRYPQAENVNEFWENLKSGKDCITEIPKDRWDIDEIYDEEKGKAGKSYSKWGGFINDVDKFDPLFFKMSPKEAELLDPQERLFLQTACDTIEDAGYTKERLQKVKYSRDSNIGGHVGVYVGVMYGEYQLYGGENRIKGDQIIWSSPSSLANRVSYYLNLHGPSMGVDTMCSSSLTAIHLAIEAIYNGQCSMAIAGGVNVSVHPNKYKLLSQNRFLSNKGKCESFGDGGEGYVPAEGVGAVLLKPLSAAVADGDQIYGVIKGSSLNHGGKTNGYTVPNPNAQAEVIKDAINRAGVKAEDFSYIETHGTGTSLGDPIEIAGLSKAFMSSGNKGQYCAIGSVKSNIGHGEAAAGISGLTKVLLQIKHKKLVPSLHSKKLNSRINFEKTPFKVQQEYKDWEIDEGRLRLSGISAFGAGGSNAHLIIEEYVSESNVSYKSVSDTIILLSAKNKERLSDQVINLRNYIESNPNLDIHNIGYTLQVGREAMEERLALVVRNVEELSIQLINYSEFSNNELFRGNIRKDKSDFILQGNAGKAYIDVAIQDRELSSLAQLWVKGVSIDWNLLYTKENHPDKISLPTYPFAKDRYWITLLENEKNVLSIEHRLNKLHPLLHQNNSSLREQRFTSEYNGSESFLSDHRVKGEKILPGVAYLELARAAGAISLEQSITRFKDVVWLSPISVNGTPEEIQISLFDEQEAMISYDIYSVAESLEVIHSQGKMFTEPLKLVPSIDVREIQGRLSGLKDGFECYELLKRLGLDYGDSFRGIEKLYYSELESLSRINLSHEEGFDLPPGLLDSALQTCIGLSLAKKGDVSLSLPFSVKEILIYGCVSDTVWCYARKNSTNDSKRRVNSYNIDMLSDSGDVMLSFIDFVTLPLPGTKEKKSKLSLNKPKITQDIDLLLFESVWETSPVSQDKGALESSSLILLVGGTVDLADHLRTSLEKEVLYLEKGTELVYYAAVQEIVKSKLSSKEITSLLVLYANEEVVDYGFISGLLKTAEQESLKFKGKTLGVPSLSIKFLDSLILIIEAELSDISKEVRYQEGNREVKKIKVLSNPKPPTEEVCIKEEGVYLITGGCGGLGHIFAKHLSKTKGTQLILTGRSTTSALDHSVLSTLNATYQSCDVTDQKYVENLIHGIIKTYGKLDGIIHSAGVIRDSFILNKTKEEAFSVLRPKVEGARYLDIATKDVALDFMIYFSSLSGVIGNIGQCDYASANAWLDTYSSYRNSLKEAGARSGITLSINWPLWKNGGMQIDANTERYMEQKWGMYGLPTSEGLAALDILLRDQVASGIVTYGKKENLEDIFSIKPQESEIVSPSLSSKPHNHSEDVLPEIEIRLKGLVSELLKIGIENIELDVDFSEYGVDSIVMMSIMNVIEESFGITMEPTAIVNYPTISLLAGYIEEETGYCASTSKEIISKTLTHREKEKLEDIFSIKPQESEIASPSLSSKFHDPIEEALPEIETRLKRLVSELLKIGIENIELDVDFSEYGVDSIVMMSIMNVIEESFGITMEPTAIVNYPTISLLAGYIQEETSYRVSTNRVIEKLETDVPHNTGVLDRKKNRRKRSSKKENISSTKEDKIAIIGMSCCLPGSDNLEEYWENLKNGKDLITDIPEERWNALDYYSKDGAIDKAYTTKGGFIKKPGAFDARYFNIGDDDAISMDPQQRLALELSRSLLAHAGYNKEELSNSNTGVYIGAKDNSYMKNNYHLLPKGTHRRVVVNNISNMISARVSDFYNLKGTSQVIDTACSSSLVAIHQGCEDILEGKTDMAIAGGVSIMVDAFGHICFSQAEVLSRDGKSYVFDERAKGFVMGEGGGFVLLKSYNQAKQDGDHIYGVISGSAVNNDGKTMGLTVPNKEGQKQVIEQALSKNNIDPSSITYYEAHGTGTLLGDPIEVKAATEVYLALSSKKEARQYCAIGSVKSNIGHTITSAGVSGVIKILLQLKHKTLVPTLHCERPHPRFRFEESPFYPNTELKPWQVERAAHRKAGISSFGFGGTNCHIVIEEEEVNVNNMRKSLPVERLSNNNYWLGQEIKSNKQEFATKEERDKLLKIEVFTYEEPYLRDHIVNNSRVILGVTYASLAIDRLKDENYFLSINSLLFQDLVVLEESEQISINIYTNTQKGLNVIAKIKDGEPHQVVEGKWSPKIENVPSIKEKLDAIIKNPIKMVLKEEVYSSDNKASVWHGESLKVVEKVFVNSEEAVGVVKLNMDLLPEHTYENVHPALLNAGLTTGSTLFQNQSDEFLPLMIKQLNVYGALGSNCFIYAKMVKSNREMIEVDYQLATEEGIVMAEVKGFVCKRRKNENEIETFSTKNTETNLPKAIDANVNVAEMFLRKQLSGFLEIDENEVSSEDNFMDMGIDSSQLISLVQKLESEMNKELYPTLFFEYQNIKDLSAFLTNEYPEAFKPKVITLNSIVGSSDIKDTIKEEKNRYEEEVVLENVAKSVPLNFGSSVEESSSNDKEKDSKPIKDPIAIIGIHGVFPEASNKEELWDNIYKEKDLIKEIPKDHFDYLPWYNENFGVEDMMYCKWGSFIDDVDKFDANFFNISPTEASMMDPQLRYMLQVLYGTAEDAGDIKTIKGSNTGLYVGVCFHDYAQRIAEQGQKINPHEGTGNAATMLSNRPSFYFNLSGPSMTIDTACSSSLVALHTAVRAIENGDCDQAFVAGTNLLLASHHYRYFCSIGALSQTGRSHSFDQRADGYVPGESVAAVLLKPLSKAEADGDKIYGIIKGGAISHGGYTPSITAPSVDGEMNVLLKAWKDADISPDTLGYIEAHGTGTKLGDPVEVNALKKAFKKYNIQNIDAASIAIGSAKAHIGHTEGAAGIVGVIKAILSINNKIIPVMPNFEEVNKYIKLSESPFYINREAKKWEMNNGSLRRAGISSFGFGGAYAHVVVEEYISKNKSIYVSDVPAIVVLSAKNVERLRDQVLNLKKHITSDCEIDLYDIAYTLQIGRESMEERLAFVVGDMDGLSVELTNYLEGNTENIFTGNIRKNKSDVLLGIEQGMAYIQTVIAKQEIHKLAEFWVNGGSIDWSFLYTKDSHPKKISLPTYPFNKKRFWFPELAEGKAILSIKQELHPLLHSNESDLNGQKYESVYTGKESFLSDHKVNGEKILPGVAYIELAREAGTLSTRSSVTQLKDITWLQPICINGKPEKVYTSIYSEGENISYDIYTKRDEKTQMHSQGRLVTDVQTAPSNYDLEVLKKQFVKSKSRDYCYNMFKDLGLDYGPDFQGIEELWYSESQAFSKITLPIDSAYVLSPGVLDSALQTCIGLALGREPLDLSVPFSVKEVNIYKELTSTIWCYVRKSPNHKANDTVFTFDIDILNEVGEVLLNFRNFVALPLKSIGYKKLDSKTMETVIYQPVWSVSSEGFSSKSDASQLILLSGGTVGLAKKIEASIGGEVVALESISALAYFDEVLKKIQAAIDLNILIDITVLYSNDEYLNFSFISGLLKTTVLETSKIKTKILGVDNLSFDDLPVLVDILEAEQSKSSSEVRYSKGNRETKALSAISIPEGDKDSVGIKEDGVYLITGGFGGLGQIFSTHINRTKNTKIILAGRSALSEDKEKFLSSLSHAEYYVCDVSVKEEVVLLIAKIKKQYGKLDGVIHSVGALRDSLIINKIPEEVMSVLSSKILGTKNLDEVISDDAIDFMLYFSSISSVLGNIGQADYASANAYLDNYALYRETQRSQGKRKGTTLSINWPLWAEGGMQVSDDVAHYLKEQWGMVPLPKEEGLAFFNQALMACKNQIALVFGVKKKIDKMLLTSEKCDLKEELLENSLVLQDRVMSDIHEMVSELLKIDISDILVDEELRDYGLDSILLMRFSNKINTHYDLNLAPTVFFNYPTIELLSTYLIEEHSSQLLKSDSIVGTSESFEDTTSMTNYSEILLKQNVEINPILKSHNTIEDIPEIMSFYHKNAEDATDSTTFIIPGMPGIVDGYYELAYHFSVYGSVYGIQMQGILEGTSVIETIEEMAKYNIAIILKTDTSQPIRLVAHSYGALVVYEMLKQMKTLDILVDSVVFIDSYPDTLKLKERERVDVFIRPFISHKIDDIEKHVRKIVSKPVAERKGFMYEILKESGVDIGLDIFSKLWAIYNTSMRIKYKMVDKLDVSITLIKANNLFLKTTSFNMGWDTYFNDVEVIDSLANHFSVFKEPHCSEWFSKLKK